MTVSELVKTDAYKWRSRVYYRIFEGLDYCHNADQWNGRCAALRLLADQTEAELANKLCGKWVSVMKPHTFSAGLRDNNGRSVEAE